MSCKKNDHVEGRDMKDYWFHDQNMPQDEVDFINAALVEAAQEDPRWAKLIWRRDTKETK